MTLLLERGDIPGFKVGRRRRRHEKRGGARVRGHRVSGLVQLCFLATVLPRNIEMPDNLFYKLLFRRRNLREKQNNKAGKAVADSFGGRYGRSGIQAVSIPPRPDDRYPDGVASDGLCLALFDACPCLAAMKVRPRSVGRRWTKPGGGNRETRRGRSIGAQRYGHLSAARPRRYAMCMVLRHVRRVA
jgi:hypothetical protein